MNTCFLNTSVDLSENPIIALAGSRNPHPGLSWVGFLRLSSPRARNFRR